jgi:hypothetical protein
LEYALDRAGIEHSSAAGKARGDAQFSHDQAQQQLEDTAQQTAQTTRGQVASARQALSAQLNADANAGEAASGAAAQASLYSAKPSYAPIGQLFNNTASNLSLYAQGYPLIGTSSYSGQTGVGNPSGFGAQVFNNGSSGRVGA